MKEKKIGRIIILVAFIFICISKGIWFFTEKYFETTNYENRQLATKPKLSLENYDTFSKDYTSYFNDNIQFRNNLITLNSEIDYFCFNRSSNDDVVVGKDNWLFYAKLDGGDPIGCYQGKNLFSKKELAAIAKNCEKQRDFVESQGKEFVLYIAPNKERMYSEYMPEKYGKPAEKYRALQVYEYIKKKTDIRIIYPYDELIEAKEKVKKNIWYKTDTHWNYIGGYVGASVLMEELGINMPKVYSKSITISKGEHIAGDLAGMLNMSKQLEFADYEYSVTGYESHDVEKIEWDFNGMARYHAKNADPRTIYVIRDSFSTHMAPYIGSQFNDSYLRHMDTYTYDDLVACNPDVVVYETVERRIDRLKSFKIK